jgi:hypothetical protein
MTTTNINLAAGDHLDIQLAGGLTVRVTHVLDDDEHSIQLRGVDCDLEGDEPGLYAILPRGEGEWPGALAAEDER